MKKKKLDFVAKLRGRNFLLPVTEYEFHWEHKWKFDYAWLSHRIAVEREGGVWIRELKAG